MGKSPRLGLHSPTPDESEEYELPSLSATDPLLPSYSDEAGGGGGGSKAHATPRSSHSHIRFAPLPSSGGGLSTHAETLRLRRRSRLRRVLLCTWATVVPLFLALALLGSWVGRDTLKELRNWDAWDSVPQDVKDWLETVVPVKTDQDLGSFPTDVGYAGPTPTGREAALLATAPSLPQVTPLSPLVPPVSHKKSFHIPSHWGNLSPYHSVASHGLDDASALIPEGCELDELHWLQRHGARYPTSAPGGPEDFARRLLDAKAQKGWKVRGELKWLRDWEYKLGREVLTPFGRSQLYNLGVAARVKYGFLLDKMKDRLPVWRTESQDRMLKSAQNFAAGFFGIPVEDQFNLEVMIEAPGFNCTLAPWNMCANENSTYPDLYAKLADYDDRFTASAVERLNELISGYTFTGRDVRAMMDTCAYETVALGYSSFCPLFNRKEWKAYSYRSSLFWWYGNSFGYPQAKAQGVGWVQELVARLTHTPISEHNSTTNATLHDRVHFPLHDPLYVDFSHDTQFALLLPTMNLTSFASGMDLDEGEGLPWDRPPKHHTFITSNIMPFATNMQVQVLSCSGRVQGDYDGDGVADDEDEDGDDEDWDGEGEGERASASSSGVDTDPDAIQEDHATTGSKRGWWPFDSDASSSSSKGKHQAPAREGRYVRIVLNDAVVPLTGINGCEEDDDGKCSFDTFVDGMKEVIGRVDFAKDCGTRQTEPEVESSPDGAEQEDSQHGSEEDQQEEEGDGDDVQEQEGGINEQFEEEQDQEQESGEREEEAQGVEGAAAVESEI